MSFNLMVQEQETTLILPGDTTIFFPMGTFTENTIEQKLKSHITVLPPAIIRLAARDLYLLVAWTLHARIRSGLPGDGTQDRALFFSGPGVVNIVFNASHNPSPESFRLNLFEGETDSGVPVRKISAYQIVDGNQHGPATDSTELAAEEQYQDRLMNANLGGYVGFLNGIDDALSTIRRIHTAFHQN